MISATRFASTRVFLLLIKLMASLVVISRIRFAYTAVSTCSARTNRFDLRKRVEGRSICNRVPRCKTLKHFLNFAE